MFPLADAFFKDRVYLSMEDFCRVCFVLYALAMRGGGGSTHSGV